MSDNPHGLDFVADQRYYHFVVARDSRGLRLGDYWKRLDSVVTPRNSVAFASPRLEVQHRKIRTDRPFARGAVAEALSEKGTGRPPYLYDLIAARIENRGESYVAFGFPFVSLGAEIVESLRDKNGAFRLGDLVGVDVPKLIQSAEHGLDPFDDMTAQVVGVHFVVSSDKSLTAVRLGGKDPLSATIYLKFLRDQVHADRFLPNQCVLACEREWRDKDSSGPPESFRSRLHVDGYGHFKFYAQSACANLRLLPQAVGHLRSLGCLEKTSGNPLLRARHADDE